MNGPGDLQQLTHSSATPDPKSCSLESIIPIVGMSSCRGRAEAFARRLSSKLRTLGSQADEGENSPEDEPIINGGNTNTWVSGHEGGEQTVTHLQPLRHESDSFFDFDCELESPGSPVDECEYLRLIESSSNTPHNSAAESGYACTSAASSNSSSDGPYFDVNSENESTSQQIPQHQPPHQQQQLNSIFEPHHEETATDEVDCIKIPFKITENGVLTVQYNGFENHNDTSTTGSHHQQSESQLKSNDLIIKTLPSEGPDIENEEKNPNPINLKHNGILKTQGVQEQILQELHKQSQDYKGHEENDNNNKRNFEKTEISIEIEDDRQQELTNIIHIYHAENGEDVLQIVVQDIQKTEVKIEEPEEKVIEVIEDAEVIKEDAGVEESLKISSETTTIDKDNTISLENVATTTDSEVPKLEIKKSKSSHLHMDTTDDEDDCRPQRVRRCSSLKTGKTPPGTPGRKKIVRFADVLGLDLADIKTFLDEIPTIPKSAYEDLEILETEQPLQMGPKSNKLLMPLFQQPGGLPKFLDIVREKLVSLENAAVTDSINHTITGSVRVRNLDFNKSVHIRYTLDGWRSYADLQANYVENSCDGFSDTFSFVMFGNSLHIGQRLEFAVRFQCKGQQYWDNNYGSNYCFQCLPTSTPVNQSISNMLPSHHASNMVGLLSPTVGESWCSSFY